MKFSDAIRLGSMMKPQGFGDYETEDGGTCAYGAACNAGGLAYEDAFPGDWTDVLIRIESEECPAGCGIPQRVDMIPHLNDDHKWTREQIADYVEKFEPQPSEQPLEHPELVTPGRREG